MASKSERHPKLKICIDNTDPVEEMEEGELDDSDEEDVRHDVRPNKSAFSSRTETSRLELVQQRPLPSPVESDEEIVKDDLGDIETFGLTKKPKPKVYENPSRTGFEVGFDPTSEFCQYWKGDIDFYHYVAARRFQGDMYSEDVQASHQRHLEAVKRKNERAKRFGIPAEETLHINDNDLKELYESLKVAAPSNGFDERGIRFETIHLRGTDNFSTDDIFEYFKGYPPKSVEWIDDSSCNVVWSDKTTAAQAMIRMSEDPSLTEGAKINPAKTHSETQGNEDNKENEQTQKEPDVAMVTDAGKTSADKQEVKQDAGEVEGMDLFEAEDDDELDLMSSDDEQDTRTAKNTAKPEKQKILSSQQKPTVPEEEKMEASEEDSDLSDSETSHKREQKPAEKDTEKAAIETIATATNAKLVKRILPPGNWRLGKPSDKAKFLFMRFATKADRKLVGAEKKSQYYRKYGNPNYGGMRGIISESRKRKLRNEDQWRGQRDAESYARRAENYAQVVVPQTSFDEQLRLAKRARKLESTSDPEDHEGYVPKRRRHYSEGSEANDDLSSYWAAAEDENTFVLGKSNKKEEEMDMERELGELLKKAPAYRYGRMHADDLQEQIQAKKHQAQSMTFEVVDDVISTANQYRRPAGADSRKNRKHSRHEEPRESRPRYHSDEEQEVTRRDVRSRLTRGSDRDRRKKGGGGDLRYQIERKKERRRNMVECSAQGEGEVEVELELGVNEEEEDDELELLPRQLRDSRGKFKYEKLRIQVDPDDV